MNHDEKIASGIRDLDVVRKFQELFPAAEHVIVQGKRYFDPDGWRVVHEWISRANMYERYVLWFVVAIDFDSDGVVSALEEPAIYIVEVEKVENGRDDEGGLKWEGSFGQLEDGGWEEIVEAGGDFAAIGVDLIADVPVDRFDTFWHDTCPPPYAQAPDDFALLAPLRFMA